MFWRQALAVPVVLAVVLAGPGLASLKTQRFGAHLKRSVMGLTSMAFNFGAIILLPLAEQTTLGFAVPSFSRNRWASIGGGLFLRALRVY